MRKFSATRAWDLCAASLTSLCMLHCLGLPLFTAVLPIASLFSESHTIHLIMVLMAVPVTAWVVLSEMTTGKNEYFILSACTGLCLMLAAVTIPPLEPFETVLTVIGGSALAGAHIWRWTQHHRRLSPLCDDR